MGAMVESPESSVRLDKWLWATRVFKTRSEAAAACRGSKVYLNQATAKASSNVRIGDQLFVTNAAAENRQLRVVGLVERRVGAALVPNFLADETPEEEREAAREKRRMQRLAVEPGMGRPTKKDRRDRERFEQEAPD